MMCRTWFLYIESIYSFMALYYVVESSPLMVCENEFGSPLSLTLKFDS
jgi:hypothetical protein